MVAKGIHGEDEYWTALPTAEPYRHARTGGTLYQAALRAELTERLGVGWEQTRNGMSHFAGIPRAVLEHFPAAGRSTSSAR